jgi:hypothetical protein
MNRTRHIALTMLLNLLLLVSCDQRKQPTVGPDPVPAAPVRRPSAATAEPATAAPGTWHPKQGFAKEVRDAPWASEMESQFLRRLKGYELATLRNVECKATLCRVELDTDQGERIYERMIEDGVFFELSKSYTRAVEADDASPTVILWWTREGYGMPHPDGTPNPEVYAPTPTEAPAPQ